MKKYLIALLISVFIVSPCAAMGPGKTIQMVSSGSPITCVGLISSGCTPGTVSYPEGGGTNNDVSFVNKFDPTDDGTVRTIKCYFSEITNVVSAKAVVYSGTSQICEAAITLVADDWAESSEFSGCTFLATDSDVRFGCTIDHNGALTPNTTYGISDGVSSYYAYSYDPDPASWTTYTNYIAATILKYEY